MKTDETFVISTYRLRDVAEAVEAYDRHFFERGHAVDITVLEDSTFANRDLDYRTFERTNTHNPSVH